ncbi:MAG: AAA family ATPase [Chloroflexia bacterium]|nr:AAA family ATPase [Chloroflexia bacterium]
MDDAKPVLILMAGMPGAGKSTVALALSAEFGMPVIDKDVVVSSLLDEDIAEDIAHAAAYRTTFDLVEHLLCAQRLSAIVDTPAVYPSVLEWATNLCAETDAILIPVLCSADGEARYDRMAAREGLRSHSKGTSRQPGTAHERFAHFPDNTIELDTMRAVDEVIRVAISRVRKRMEDAVLHDPVDQ